MTAHIVVPALDPSGDPATLSRPILTGILREELGYDGVVVTDSLGMEGVRDKYGDDRVPVLAPEGRCRPAAQPAGSWTSPRNAVLNAVRSGELTEERIDESVLRVLRLKTKHGLFQPTNVIVDETKVAARSAPPRTRRAPRRSPTPPSPWSRTTRTRCR